ncbi:histidine--tRNA ligase [bacterium CG10_46_32]|nr:MAG: histidine--tRNA ligase [bacterium CG10_46_32]PIR56453.1 MAG: histidine--tRNA ligase [Parcubacteria group bacterium CG10_big_fil_rev_8_21_14_0_10_46_32]
MADIASKKRKRASKTPELLRGFRDVIQEEAPYWQHVQASATDLLLDYSYSEIQLPILEATSLFKRTIGEHTDIVSKEMFTFEDQGGDSITLRPELTAGMVRAYIEHGMFNRPQPVKMYSIGPAFRYERPQAGRYRQFNQLSVELFGDAQPVADAEVIFISYLLCKQLGLDVTIHINSLGSSESREDYVQLLKEYIKPKRSLLCEDCKKRITKNPLRLLDCKEEACRALFIQAPLLVDNLDDESKKHFVAVLEHLDESEVPYELDPYIVRGLDYYNRTAFEIVASVTNDAVEGEEATVTNLIVGGGGRYDGLVEILGGRNTPAIGMAFGLERLVSAFKKTKSGISSEKKPQVFLAQLGEEAAKHAFTLFETLRSNNIRVRANFGKTGLKPQLELADKLGVVYTVILGQKELLDQTVIIRDMENGIQEVVDLTKIVDEIKKRLKKGR